MILYGTLSSPVHWVVFIGVSILSLGIGYPIFTKKHGNFADLL
jgi:ABC-type polysaccharide/polyol phosphate export permease